MSDKQFTIEDEWTESAENEPEVEDGVEVEYENEDEIPGSEGDLECRADKFEQRDSSQLIKPRGKCVTIEAPDGVRWDV